MAQTTIQGSFLGDATVTGAKIGADFISAQTALTTTLATTDEIIVSDAGVIKRIDISVWSASTETFTNKSIDLEDNTLTGSVAEFNAALQSESFATLGGTETLVTKTLTTPTINAGTLNLMTVFTVANDIDVGAYEVKALKFESDQATGTAPLTVASTTVVTNLNADLLDGVQGALYSQIAAAETLLQKTLTSPVLNTGVSGTAILDEDNLATNSATQLATQQSIKAYVDNLSTGTDWQSVVTASTLTAVAGRGYPINTTSNACTVTLPASASVGDTIEFVDYARTFSTNALTINQNSLNFQGGTSPNPVYDTLGQSVKLVYVDATKGWIPVSDDDSAYETPQSYTVDYLVIAGGGSGGVGASSGGGGAGGYRNSYSSETSGGGGSSETGFTVTSGIVYTVTIGAGGTASAGASGSGVASSVTGSDITNVVSTGGGDGGDRSNSDGAGGNDGATGGSGGGGGTTSGNGHVTTGGTATSGQGYAGGTGQHTSGSHEGGGGGGGAGVIGQSGYKIVGSSGQGGAGGNGLASSITGSPVTRAGGGGAAGNYNGAGGSGGGGVGTSTPGTANTGGGGGGGTSGGNGGSGVVIIRMATSNYSGTTSGSPGVTTSGSDTIITFNANGTYTG